MATEIRAVKQLDKPKSFTVWLAASVALVMLFSFQVQAKPKAKTQNIAAKGKEGAKPPSQQKSTKKFALKKPLKLKAESKVAKASSKKSKPVAKLAQTTNKPTNQTSSKSKFLIAKNAQPQLVQPKTEAPTHDMFKAFSSNQQNRLIVQTSKPKHEASNSQNQTKKMPNLLPTSSSDSQRAANMLEADSGVHGDDGYTRTQIVDAPTRKPTSVAAPKAPERVAVTFEHETK